MIVCVIRDVERCGVSKPVCLAGSDQCDAVLCALLIDLDFDGQLEVLLGTYGQVHAHVQETHSMHARHTLDACLRLSSAGPALLQIPTAYSQYGGVVPADVEAELQEPLAVNHLPGPDWGWIEGAGHSDHKRAAYITGHC